MPSRRIEQQIEHLSLLRQAPRSEALAALRKALGDRSNLVVAKAAKIAAGLDFRELESDLLRSFDRLFDDPVHRDPQCWGKNAIACALRDLRFRDSGPFLRGIGHVQMEPAFGGPVDTAVALRGVCLLSLIACTDLHREEILRHIVDRFTDNASPVRVDAIRALEQMEGEAAPLLLRLKARLGDEEASVTGQVFDSLLKLEKDRAIRFVAGFLTVLPGVHEEVREEAALALGSSRLEGAVDVLRESWVISADPDFRLVLLRALSSSRQQPALEFLLHLVEEGRPQDAQAALEALSLHRDSPEIRRSAETAAVDRGAEAARLFATFFGEARESP